ncbi:MAG: SCO family protein [Limnohabitans sp.]
MSGSKLSNPAENNTPVDAPLAMTVHELPMPADVAQADERRTRSGRIKMLLLLLVCMAPVIASYITYYLIRPAGSTRNHADLIQPARDLPQTQVQDLQGHSVPLALLKGQWLIVAVGGGACDETCQKNLYFQRQLREMQGKDKDRIDRVWLVSDDAPVPAQLQPALAQATVLRVQPEVLESWLAPAAGHQLQDHLYLVDPMGNWMMRFPAHMDVEMASKVKRDLERLLRASNSWDNAGR